MSFFGAFDKSRGARNQAKYNNLKARYAHEANRAKYNNKKTSGINAAFIFIKKIRKTRR